MPRCLDRDRPHDEVYGIPGVTFSQGGKLFRGDGQLADGQPDDEPEEQAAPAGGLASLPVRQLRVMVESFGGAFTNREAALAFLSSQGQAA